MPAEDSARLREAALAAEFRDYAAVLADARAAADRNAADIADAVSGSAHQDALVRDTATAIGEVSVDAGRMAQTVDDLRRHVGEASGAGAGASRSLRGVSDALAVLHERLRACAEPVAGIGESVDGIAAMLHVLEKLAARAELLAVNAAIEAAHVDGASSTSRFAIVATEVRALSASARDAAAGVTRIASDLHEAAASVARATSVSTAAAARTVAGVRDSEAALDGAHRAIAGLEGTVAAIASASDAQSAALEAIVGIIEEVAAHADGARRATADAGQLALAERVRAAEGRLRASPDDGALVDDAQRAIVGDLIALAVAAAHNGVAWRSIDAARSRMRDEMELVRRSVAASVQAARSASDAARGMHDVAASIKVRYDGAMDALEGGLLAIADVHNAVADADRRIEAMAAAVARTDEIVRVIDAVSAETGLLSLNAAIEAARAGKHGRGFGVIATEIRRLADATREAAAAVAAAVARVGARSELVRAAVAEVAACASGVTDAAGGARVAVEDLRAALEAALDGARDVATAAGGQVDGFERVLENSARSAEALDADARARSQRRRFDLYAIGDRAHHIAARRGVARETARVRRLLDDVAERAEAVLEGAVASGRVPLGTLFDLRYEPVGERFTTAWDHHVDEAMIALLDEAFTSASFARPVALTVTDLNGFAYACPRRAANGAKRFLEDPQALRLARAGLGGDLHAVGRRARYDAFEGAGCDLARPDGERPWTFSVVARDVDVVSDLVMPIFVRGRRHGAIRLGYAADLV